MSNLFNSQNSSQITSGSTAGTVSSQLSEFITVTVFPCGKEDVIEESEKPYELKIMKKFNENSLKDILGRSRELWEPIFKKYMQSQSNPNFSVYKKAFLDQNEDTGKMFHIIYMKSNQKALPRNYTALALEMQCSNRFYGPLVVAFNMNKHPCYLQDFRLSDNNYILQ